jgi:hypothetical protein
LKWYTAAFKTTKLQARYPCKEAYAAGLGFADSSFAFHTLDGEANGGQDFDYYFWTLLEDLKITSFWKVRFKSLEVVSLALLIRDTCTQNLVVLVFTARSNGRRDATGDSRDRLHTGVSSWV